MSNDLPGLPPNLSQNPPPVPEPTACEKRPMTLREQLQFVALILLALALPFLPLMALLLIVFRFSKFPGFVP